ncbi:tRNA methyltransferase complex GCD14 subunit [Venustampulla echinocandica]|uniref:tRNA (adenine(58)-N(1))-methyltransferase catalytic subunit TRM61 n=1 Tax=Venustampulla echinocandica TaxID=2656787 RepID=A0A370TT00_9HELO|nr:tRNA methyltransferase complex GCD14 subunit [Venustampulla echinocandica]RDL38661.1 tRNA methyltransferase complex GCD14 subunit [Venustampulla echinocandica]
MTSNISPFLYPGPIAKTDSLAIIHLKRDLQIPTILRDHDEDDEGYSEGKVVNTRFGSFPHTTLIGLPWGSQVRASVVDTGSRGRRDKQGQNKQKRKREESEAEAGDSTAKKGKLEDGPKEESGGDTNISTPVTVKEEKEAVVASTGFIHLLPPTPENWTSSLPHRTQVVYTPDYSYILHRLRARPGTNLIEAGAGSGSFTHASARSVFKGYLSNIDGDVSAQKKKNLGKVWSYEFHEQRHQKLEEELQDHGLEGIVQVTHRDVCEDGFLVDNQSPGADAIFLDLPAPWLALPHLTRSALSTPPKSWYNASGSGTPNPANGTKEPSTTPATPFISPLNPSCPVHICTFSPCIEQVQRTVSVMRRLGWVDIEMVELSQRRYETRRERIGIDSSGGPQTAPATVSEALARLIEVEGNSRIFHENGEKPEAKREKVNPNNRAKLLENLVEKKTYKEGNLIHRLEPEIKAHTSYLVFAVLPQEWTAEDEEKARLKWDAKGRADGDGKGNEEAVPISKRQLKKAARQAQKDRAEARAANGQNSEEAVEVKNEDETRIEDNL